MKCKRIIMYSICGENDYVNELGIKIIPEDHIYYIQTPVDAMNFSDFHDIKYMFSDKKDEDGIYTFNGSLNDVAKSQGELGIYAKELSAKIMSLPEEERNECAMVIMQMMELGGESKTGLDGERMTIEDVSGFINQGVPTILSTLLKTDNGRNLLLQYGKEFLEQSIEKNGIWGTVGILGLSVLTIPIASKLAEYIFEINKILVLYEEFSDYIGKRLKDADEFLSDTYNKAKDIFNLFNDKISGKRNNSSTLKYACFSVNKPLLEDASEDLRDCARPLKIMAEDIRDVGFKVPLSMFDSVTQLASNLEVEAKKVKRMHETMDEITNVYINTDKRIMELR